MKYILNTTIILLIPLIVLASSPKNSDFEIINHNSAIKVYNPRTLSSFEIFPHLPSQH